MALTGAWAAGSMPAPGREARAACWAMRMPGTETSAPSAVVRC